MIACYFNGMPAMPPWSDLDRRPHASSRPLRALLAVSADFRCERLHRFLATSPRIDLVARTDAESRVLQLYFRLRPDVTLLDWRIAASEPARVVGLLRRVAPAARIVSIVPSLDSVPARAARALGADVVATCATLEPALLELAGEFDEDGEGDADGADGDQRCRVAMSR